MNYKQWFILWSNKILAAKSGRKDRHIIMDVESLYHAFKERLLDEVAANPTHWKPIEPPKDVK